MQYPRSQSLLSKRLASGTTDESLIASQEASLSTMSDEKQEDLTKKIRENLNKMFGEDIHTRSKEPEFREKMLAAIIALLEKETEIPMSKVEQSSFATNLINDILGFGLLTPLVEDKTITEIMVVGPKKVFVERQGQLTLTDLKFPSKASVKLLIDRIVGPLGRRCDESSPNVDARLPDGSRVSASIDPIALDGPYITIRKFPDRVFTLEDYVKSNSMSPQMATFIKAAVEARCNIVGSGGTGSGKTTFLNCMSSYIDSGERIITIEDSAELQLKQAHVERYEARQANVEGKGAIPIQQLVINALRKRPDRVVVGEVRGGEALDMLQAMNTGHDGSLTTGHANSPREMINRLETMVLMSGMELPVRAIRETIAGAVHLIVQISRMKGGRRGITAITEVVGIGRDAAEKLGLKNVEKDAVVLKDIFKFVKTGVENGVQQGYFTATGYIPMCLERFEEAGIYIDKSIFTPAPEFQEAV